MGLTRIAPLQSPEEILECYPGTSEHRVAERQEEVKSIIDGRDDRLLMVVGPCSAWPSKAVREYADRLARLQEDLRECMLFVMRLYIQKPRTTKGWPGPMNYPDPRPSAQANIPEGILTCRNLMHDIGKQLPLADEMLFTHNADYFGDLLSYQAIGARSTTDMEHRYLASSLDCAVGVKNPTSGDITEGVDGIECVQVPHTMSLHGWQVETTGNPHAHLVLRGGKTSTNYGPASIARAHKELRERKVQNPAILVDASHDNCRNGHGKDPLLQRHVVKSVLVGIEEQREEYSRVRGFMIESFIKRGNQPVAEDMDRQGLSITDPCLSWEDTEKLLREMADTIDRIPQRASTS